MDNVNKKCNGYEAMYTFLSEEDFAKHLETCSLCREEHEKMQKVSKLIQEAKPYIKQKKKSKRVLMTAAVFFAAVFATMSVPLCMVGVNVYDDIVAQHSPSVEEMGLPVDEYGLLYVD